jgi:hypothetical protein
MRDRVFYTCVQRRRCASRFQQRRGEFWRAQVTSLIDPSVPLVDASTADDLSPVSALTLDFLTWVASSPRSYADTMEAWRSSCPRFTIWEDALEDGLVCLESGSGARLSKANVVLTPRGRAVFLGTRRNEPAIAMVTP